MKNLLVILGLAATVAANASTNLVVNGDFEQHSSYTGSWSYVNNLNGWTVTGAKAEVGANSVYGVTTRTGSASTVLELDSTTNYTISQAFSGLQAGQKMVLEFDYAKRASTSDSTNLFQVKWNDQVINLAPTSSTMQRYNVELLALGSTNTLSFIGKGTADSYGALIDNVNLGKKAEAVPEPATMAVSAVGLIGALRRRRQK